MVWNPAKPETGSPLLSAPIRDNWEALDAFMEEIRPGGVHLGARVTNSASIVVPHGVDTLMTFNTDQWDIGGFHSHTVNPGRLTAPIAGRYLIIGAVALGTLPDFTEWWIAIYLNNTIGLGVYYLRSTSLTDILVTIPAIAAMQAGDYVVLYATQRNATSAATSAWWDPLYTPMFSIQYLGAL